MDKAELLFPQSINPEKEITILIHLNKSSDKLNVSLNINNEDMKKFGITPLEFDFLSEHIDCIFQQIIGFHLIFAMKKCVFCGNDSTQWQRINGHLCFDCHIKSNGLKGCNHENSKKDSEKRIPDNIKTLY